MKLFASILSVVFFTTAPTVLLAKGDTVKITIEGTALPSPIEITDPAVRQFNLWSGPGTFMNGVEGRQGFIIDWTNRLDEAPVGLHHYRVSFYEGCELRESAPCRTGERSLVYVVYYDYNPSTEQRLPNQDGLTIKVLEGEDGVNIIQKNTAVKPVVEVRDRNNLPVAGATVVFILPDSGPSATFARGSRVLTVRTNSAGRASATSMHSVGMGAFNIGVTASFQNQVATATIAQTNFATVAAANAAIAAGTVPAGASIATGGGFLGLGISTAVVGAIAAGAAAAVTVAVVKKGPPGPPKGTIGVGGGPVFGPLR